MIAQRCACSSRSCGRMCREASIIRQHLRKNANACLCGTKVGSPATHVSSGGKVSKAPRRTWFPPNFSGLFYPREPPSPGGSESSGWSAPVLDAAETVAINSAPDSSASFRADAWLLTSLTAFGANLSYGADFWTGAGFWSVCHRPKNNSVFSWR